MAHAVSAVQTKLSTASSVSVQLICDRLYNVLLVVYNMVDYSMIDGGKQSATMCRYWPDCFYIQSASRAVDWIGCLLFG